MAISKVSWTTSSRPDGTFVPGYCFSPWRGCTKVSAGCASCYAEAGSHRNPRILGVWGPKGTRVVAAENAWDEVRRWDRQARDAGERRRVFPSICDPFEEWDGPMTDAKGRFVPASGEFAAVGFPHAIHRGGLASMDTVRVRFLRLIERTPWLDWLVLTKRPEFMAEWLRWYCMQEACGLPRNLWCGCSCEDQATANERIPHLLGVPASVLFVSLEPLLAPVDIAGLTVAREADPGWSSGPHRRIGWFIVGGESGPHAQPCDPAWIRDVVGQCRRREIPCYVKQDSGPYPDRQGRIDDATWAVKEYPEPEVARA